jgi:hypothetical protein
VYRNISCPGVHGVQPSTDGILPAFPAGNHRSHFRESFVTNSRFDFTAAQISPARMRESCVQ